jgi:hypothetical protein
LLVASAFHLLRQVDGTTTLFLTFACSGYTPPSVRSRFNRKIEYRCSPWGV